jgi:hypothetical protein
MLHTIRGGKSPQPNRVTRGQPAQLEPVEIQGNGLIAPAPSADDLTYTLAYTERMASILSTLLSDRIVDTGNRRHLTVGRQDVEDIRFAAGQPQAMLARTGAIWRAIP